MSVFRNYRALSRLVAGVLVAMTVACGPAEPAPSVTTVVPTAFPPSAAPTVTSATLAPTRTPKPDVPPNRESPTPTPTVDPSIEWTIGEPVPLPEGMTLVLGTGCNNCGGLHSTYVRFDAGGTTVLRDEGEEVHIDGYFVDATHLYLATCTSNEDCSRYTADPENPVTTLWESFDRGTTWRAVETTGTLYSIVGRAADGQLLLRQQYPGDVEYLYPSGEPLDAPLGAPEGWGPYLHDANVVWQTLEHRFVDATGSLVADFSDVVPRDAQLRSAVPGPAGVHFITWHEYEGRRTVSRAALVRDGNVQLLDGTPFALGPIRWLDEQTLVTSVEYPRDQLAEIPRAEHLSGQRIPTFVDLETRTLHPILEFLAADAPQGRNTIEGIWQD